MTATTVPRSANHTATPATALERDLAATIAVTAYSFMVAVGFARVFSGWDFLTDLGLLVVVGHGTSFVLRRLRVSAWIAIPVLLIELVWVLASYQYRSTFAGIFP